MLSGLSEAKQSICMVYENPKAPCVKDDVQPEPEEQEQVPEPELIAQMSQKSLGPVQESKVLSLDSKPAVTPCRGGLPAPGCIESRVSMPVWSWGFNESICTHAF